MCSLLISIEVLVEVFRFLSRAEISQIELANSWFHALVEEHLSEYPHIRINCIIGVWLGGSDWLDVIGCKIHIIGSRQLHRFLNIHPSQCLNLNESLHFLKVAYLRADTTIYLRGTNSNNSSILQLNSHFMTTGIRIDELLHSLKHLWACNALQLQVYIKNGDDDGCWLTPQAISYFNECALDAGLFVCTLEKTPRTLRLMQICSNRINLKGPIENYPVKDVYSWLISTKIPTKSSAINSLYFTDPVASQETANYIKELLAIIEIDFEQQLNVQFVIWMVPKAKVDSDFWQLLPSSFVRHNKDETVIFKYSKDKLDDSYANPKDHIKLQIWRYMKCNEYRIFGT